MGVYTTASLHGINENFLGEVNTVNESIHDPGIKGTMAIITENEENFNEMMKAVGFDELRYFEETGREMIYEGDRAKSFFAKLRAFFTKVYQKIKELFQKFMGLLDRATRSDKAFVKKYNKLLLNTSTKGFEFKGFKFTLNAVTVAGVDSAIDAYMSSQNLTGSLAVPQSDTNKIEKQQKIVVDWRSDRPHHQDKMRGCVGGSGSLKDNELGKKLFSMFRDGKDEKVELKNVSISEQIEIISNYKDARKTAKDNFKKLESTINKTLKNLKEQEKKLSKPGDKLMQDANATAVRYISELYSATKDKLNILQKVNGTSMSAMRQERAQAKAICTRLVTYKPTNESARYGRKSALDNVKFK